MSFKTIYDSCCLVLLIKTMLVKVDEESARKAIKVAQRK